MKTNKYINNSIENLKITYYLGAGASYNAVPIWQAQSKSMIQVADNVVGEITDKDLIIMEDGKHRNLYNDKKLLNIFTGLRKYGELAMEYGSIDIYARRLHLLDKKGELNDLKFYLSIYFDLWENEIAGVRTKSGQIENKQEVYTKIDKRYFSLLSVLLEKGETFPKLNENVSFISWNYDLQLERAFESFLSHKTSSLVELNDYFHFMESDQSSFNNIIHLNGFRGMFRYQKNSYETVQGKNSKNLYSYLNTLIENYSEFNRSIMDYQDTIKYAWEKDSKSLENAKKRMHETNILVIIGYSFPAFNRKIDQILIDEFVKGTNIKRVIYQDPNGNVDIITSIFGGSENVKYEKLNTEQFHVPHEFLFPRRTKEIIM